MAEVLRLWSGGLAAVGVQLELAEVGRGLGGIVASHYRSPP
jgi:hypothetical protein